MPCVNSTTMFPELKRGVKKLIKKNKNSFVLHQNSTNGSSCCGGKLTRLPLDQRIYNLVHLPYEISKIYTWAFDKVKVHAIALMVDCTCDQGEYACVNYLGKQFGHYFHGDVLLFKNKAHAETFTRQFRDFRELKIEVYK